MASTFQYSPLSQCVGKASFAHYGLAAKRAKRLREKTGDPVEAYRCPHCSLYHLGESNHVKNVKTYKRRKRAMKEMA